MEIKGKPYNNAMQAWEGQYTDQQLAAILTYVRSDWGNNAPAITADMVKQIRDEFKDRKEQWTWPEIQKIPPKNLTRGGSPACGPTKARRSRAGWAATLAARTGSRPTAGSNSTSNSESGTGSKPGTRSDSCQCSTVKSHDKSVSPKYCQSKPSMSQFFSRKRGFIAVLSALFFALGVQFTRRREIRVFGGCQMSQAKAGSRSIS